MIVVVAPEPAPWIAPALAALAAVDAVELWAPWAIAPRWAALPGPAGRFARRRTLDGAHGQPGWALAQAAARWWAGAAVDRRYRVSFAERALVDVWAARRLARRVATPRVVVAATGAALRTFAVAASRGARTALVADLPWLRALHADLDRAATALPARAFLRRFRAPREAIVRQEMERAAADHVAVRGHYAASLCIAAGVEPARLAALPGASPRAAPTAPLVAGTERAIVLAGLASARAGVDVALAARDAVPGLTLRVRTGDGTEPRDLLGRPGVEAIADGAGAWRGVLAVVAPAWCESYPAEVEAAAARGVPVIATRAAAGFTPAALIPPGDAAGLAAAIARVGDLSYTNHGAASPLPALPLVLGRPPASCA